MFVIYIKENEQYMSIGCWKGRNSGLQCFFMKITRKVILPVLNSETFVSNIFQLWK
jgi:hypothetical protein